MTLQGCLPAAMCLVVLVSSGCANGGDASVTAPTSTSPLPAGQPATFLLTGVVRDATPAATPVEGARVQILDGIMPHVFTDAQGAFRLPEAPAGRLLLEVSKDGYDIWETELVIGGDTQLTIILAASPAP